MANRVPPEAFAYYLSLGPNRSYEAVAEHFAVSKTAITNRATKENWQARVAEADRKLRETSEANALECRKEMDERHLKIVRVIQSRALETLKSIPIQSGMAAVRAVEIAMKMERLIRGEPNDRTAVSVEDVLKKNFTNWFSPDAETAIDGSESAEKVEEGPEDDGDDDETEA